MSIKKIQIALASGDGAGPEMMAEAVRIAKAAAQKDNIEIDFVETPMGWSAYAKYGDTLPKESLAKATELGTLFFGGVGDPKYDATIGKENPEMLPEPRALLNIRKKWGLLLNFRPVIYYQELAHLAKIKLDKIPEKGIRQIYIRFLLEDSYFGNADLADKIPDDIREKLNIKPKTQVTGSEDIVTDLAYYKADTIEKYLREAFAYAKNLDLPLILIDKANVVARYVLWRRIAEKVHQEEFPDVEMKNYYIDAANSFLFEPHLLNGVIACGNEHGDILSDGAVAAAGSMGLMHSSAINPETRAAMFESGAGTAPSLAGKNIANPLGRILTGALMLRHIGATKGADAIELAAQKVLKQGWRTGDLAQADDPADKILGTKEMGQKVLENL